MKLSKRLQAICDLVPNGSKIIDIGADHGLVDIYLNKAKNCECLAIDISKNCIDKIIENNIKAKANIQALLNDGLTNLILEDEIIIISGLGTNRMLEILNRPLKNDLILSTHNDISKLCEEVLQKGYVIEKEILVHDKRDYTIIYFKYNNQKESH